MTTDASAFTPAAASPSVPGRPRNKLVRALWGTEKYLTAAVVAVLIAVPIIEAVLRFLKIPGFEGIPEAGKIVQHLILVVTFLGGMLTTREGQHLAIGVVVGSLKKPWQAVCHFASALISTTVSTALSLSALSMVVNAFSADAAIGGFPIHIFLFFLPIGYLFMGIRFSTSAPLP
ncbi:MAG TPA: TRAP transporter small permease subunit, partial [Spirochaetia bacterium]|nr:TRAP transporter small permease subunit [Spirochaetia bacterium]